MDLDAFAYLSFLAVSISFYIVFFVLEEPFWHEVTFYCPQQNKNISRIKNLYEYTFGDLLTLPFYLVMYSFFIIIFAVAICLLPLWFLLFSSTTQRVISLLFSTTIFKEKISK